MPFRLFLLLGGLLMMRFAGADSVQVYKWVDESGTMHFSSQPPPENASSVILRYRGDAQTGSPRVKVDTCLGVNCWFVPMAATNACPSSRLLKNTLSRGRGLG